MFIFPSARKKISDLGKSDRHLRGFWHGLGALEVSFSKKKKKEKKSPALPEGGGQKRVGGGTGEAAASQTNHPSVIIEVLRLMIDWGNQPARLSGLSSLASPPPPPPPRRWRGEGRLPGTGLLPGRRSTNVWRGRGVRLKIIRLTFSTWFCVLQHQCKAGHFELCAVLAQHSMALQSQILFQMAIQSILGENSQLGKFLKKLNSRWLKFKRKEQQAKMSTNRPNSSLVVSQRYCRKVSLKIYPPKIYRL